jgi:hypothetical protein
LPPITVVPRCSSHERRPRPKMPNAKRELTVEKISTNSIFARHFMGKPLTFDANFPLGFESVCEKHIHPAPGL